VLLSDVPDKMSGELCVYPGSHEKMALHFAPPGVIEDVRVRGNKALPTGAGTDTLFGGAAAVHCTGRAGDVFVANYLTAHFVAPNMSPHIRYAVYFRVHAPSLEQRRATGGDATDSMVR
jgi:hypothetical protein